MAKKSVTAQELANIYPWWAKIRADDQSVGFQLLNALAKPMEDMDKQLDKMRKNEFLSTVNLDEIDQTFRVQLPTTFEFDVDNSDPTNPISQAPTVQGLVISTQPTFSGYVNVSVSESNDIKSFWYDSVPNRASLLEDATGETELLSLTASEFPYSGLLEHHLVDDNEGGGRIWITCDGGVQYVKKNERNEVQRGRVVIKGVTRKGLEEEETIVFPWDEKQPSLKEWRRITEVNVYDMEEDVEVTIRSADFAQPPYWDWFNLRISDARTKVDTFWQLNDEGNKLERVGLITDEWQQALLGFSDKEVKESWDLLGTEWNYPATGVDIAVQPFTDRAWMITASGILYCYDLSETVVSGVDHLQSRSAGPLAQIECAERRLTLGEDIVFTPWLARAIKEITRYRVWYQDPDGNKFGIVDGSPVAYSADFWDVGMQIKRIITDEITIPTTLRGEYLIVLETEYVDGTADEDRIIVQVQFKQPLAIIDLNDIISTPVTGIDFDADQKLWIQSGEQYWKLDLHTDIMIIDYQSKILYFKENYSAVQVTI